MIVVKRLHEALEMFQSEAAILADLKPFAIFPLPARQPPPALRRSSRRAARSSRACARRRQRTGGHRRGCR
jgi:hypothetical protein